MKRLITTTYGNDLNLWNSGDLLDYLDECIQDSQISASSYVYAADNTNNKVDNVFTTPEFDSALDTLKNDHRTDILKKLKKVIKGLLYEGAVTTQYHNHRLSNKNGGNPHNLNELHLDGNTLLHYRYWGDNTLIISLKLADILNHKNQKQAVSDPHRYQELSREFSTSEYNDDGIADAIVDNL